MSDNNERVIFQDYQRENMTDADIKKYLTPDYQFKKLLFSLMRSKELSTETLLKLGVDCEDIKKVASLIDDKTQSMEIRSASDVHYSIVMLLHYINKNIDDFNKIPDIAHMISMGIGVGVAQAREIATKFEAEAAASLKRKKTKRETDEETAKFWAYYNAMFLEVLKKNKTMKAPEARRIIKNKIIEDIEADKKNGIENTRIPPSLRTLVRNLVFPKNWKPRTKKHS